MSEMESHGELWNTGVNNMGTVKRFLIKVLFKVMPKHPF